MNGSDDVDANGKPAHTAPNAGSGDPTDGRKPYEWTTRYPPKAVFHIRLEATYLFLLLLTAYFLLFLAWKGWASRIVSLTPEESMVLKKYMYYSAAGLLGGVAFGIKYFYRVVARGYWHLDRRIWRLKSPLLAMTLAFVVGAMIDASWITSKNSVSSATIVSTGFVVGYFADQAVAKMYEIANVIFGRSTTTKAGDGKESKN